MSNNNSIIENDPFIRVSKKALLALENLIKNNNKEVPVKFNTMLELAIGALADAQSSGEVDLVDVFYEHREFTFDAMIFEERGEYILHDILAQVVCFRVISMMQEFLNHIEVAYEIPDELVVD
jgi:hypothetical protein